MKPSRLFQRMANVTLDVTVLASTKLPARLARKQSSRDADYRAIADGADVAGMRAENSALSAEQCRGPIDWTKFGGEF